MPNPIEIKSHHLKTYLERTRMSPVELAKFLNVSPLSVRRWLNKKEPDPTSTAFSVLIPLLLAEGIELLPEPDESAVSTQLATLAALGFSEEELRSEQTLKTVRRSASLLTTPEVKSSRALFEALSKAWRKIDESIAQSGRRKKATVNT